MKKPAISKSIFQVKDSVRRYVIVHRASPRCQFSNMVSTASDVSVDPFVFNLVPGGEVQEKEIDPCRTSRSHKHPCLVRIFRAIESAKHDDT